MAMPESSANLLRPSAQHFLVEKIDQLFHFGRARFPFDSDVHILGVFAVDDDVHALGMLHRRRNAREIAHRAHAGVEIEELAAT